MAAFVLLSPLPCAAHEMGSGRVEASFFADGTYRVDVRIDPEATLRRLELAAGDELSEVDLFSASRQDESRFESLLMARRDQLEEAMSIRFDGAAVVPRLELLGLETSEPAPVESPPSAPGAEELLRRLSAQSGVEAVLRLSGEIPGGARSFTWRYSLPAAPYALILREDRHERVVTQWLEGETLSEPFELDGAAPGRLEVARQYLVLGFTHIVPKGLDHILFVLGIFLLCTRLRPLLAQVTAFTIAHTLSLGLSTYGVVSLPSSVVEPLIALSIVYVAVENVLTPDLSRWRVVVVFAFGLLHGLGFAGVLGELGLPRSAFLTALAAFNVGVELGQLAVIGIAFLLVASWARDRPWYRPRIVIPASLAIAAVGLFWTLQRVLGG